MISARSAKKIRKELINLDHSKYWSCWVVEKACGNKAETQYARFFGQIPGGRWPGLELPMVYSSDKQNLQRELMLELFAHTRGKL